DYYCQVWDRSSKFLF
nr:immunoglobulin light chain junction region [Macaca mulatta]